MADTEDDKIIFHWHHKIPRYAGGTDDPSNLIRLTVAEHADAHYQLWIQHGNWQDHVAYRMLSGQITRAEAIKLSQKNADKSWMKTPEGRRLLRDGQMRREDRSPWNKGLTKETTPVIAEQAKLTSQMMKDGLVPTIGDRMRGKTFEVPHRVKLSEKALARERKICEHCGNDATPQMFSRWHGDKCRIKKE